jgi:hypothetical protein
MGLADQVQRRKRMREGVVGGAVPYGGYSVGDWVPPRVGPHGLELHMPLANYEGPRTDVRRRLREGVKPTTHTDAGARIHDIQYHNIGAKLAKGQITRAEAIKRVKQSDNRLLSAAFKSKLSLNPVEHAHSTAAIAGILGKKAAQSVGAMDELSFIGKDPDELDGTGKKRKKKDPMSGLKRRLKMSSKK